MARVEPDEETLKSCRAQFPESLIGLWSTFGDGYQMEFGHSAIFERNGRGMFEMWSLYVDDDEESEHSFSFSWRVLQGFEVEIQPAGSSLDGSDRGNFIVEFYLSDDPYGNKYLAIRDGREAEGKEPLWWFADSQKHPMRRLQQET